MSVIKKYKTNDSEKTVVIATSYITPLQHLPKIEKMLQDIDAKSDIIFFDLLCSNGYEWNRFGSMEYDGQKFIRNTFKIIKQHNVDLDLIKEVDCYYSEHPHLIKNSVLC